MGCQATAPIQLRDRAALSIGERVPVLAWLVLVTSISLRRGLLLAGGVSVEPSIVDCS